jgi:CelD/BcsL family acetyltransferase involved in cellulose biosynthesis
MIAIASQQPPPTTPDLCAGAAHVSRFATLDELAPYADDWDRLAAGEPFRSWTWLSRWWMHYGPQTDAEARRCRLAVLGVFSEEGTLLGIAPWYVDHTAMQGRVLRPLGSGEVCSDYLGVLCDPAVEDTVLKALAGYLLDNAHAHGPDALRWDLLELDGVDAEDARLAALVDHLSAAGCTVHCRPGMSCWRLELAGDWDTYLASLDKRQRQKMRRLKLNVFDAGRAVLHSPTALDELLPAMEILVDLHQRRRTTLGEPGCFASPRFLSFYRDVVPAMARLGQLQFHWLELDGRPVAANYELVGAGVVYSYQCGVDPAAMEHEPGNLINMAMLWEAMSRGYRAFDFLRGDEQYKSRFGAQPKPTVEFRVVPRRALAQLRHKLWLARYRAKEWLKSRRRKTAK